MFELLISDGVTDLTLQFLYYLLIAAHICLFVDMSPLQKHATSKPNYYLASIMSAVIPSASIRLMTFPSIVIKHSVGLALVLVFSLILTLVIQQLTKIQFDF